MVKYNFLEIDMLLSFFRKEEISINGAFVKMQNPIIYIFLKIIVLAQTKYLFTLFILFKNHLISIVPKQK
jgi:hypothetical protein